MRGTRCIIGKNGGGVVGENYLCVFPYCKNLTFLSPRHVFFPFLLQNFFYLWYFRVRLISTFASLDVCQSNCYYGELDCCNDGL